MANEAPEAGENAERPDVWTLWQNASRTPLFQASRLIAESMAAGWNAGKPWWRRRRSPLAFWPQACDVARSAFGSSAD